MITNELMLVLTLIAEYAGVALIYLLFRRSGLYLWTVVATIAANIEVLILVKAFGTEMTLGNIIFATTFLVTDVLSELHGKEAAQKAVKMGITASIIFTMISSSWLLYGPSPNDFVFPSIKTIFSNTPRIVLASMAVYAVVQFFDVWLYHKWWAFTDKKTGDHDRFLWLRNNGSTLISQLLNAILYPIFAFAGTYEWPTIVSIIVSGYVIFIVTSLLDTPFIYLCRRIGRKYGTERGLLESRKREAA